MSNNVLITQKGLDFITSAHSNGMLINVSYFLPVYDYRLDGTIQSTLTTSAFSAVFDPNALTPFGEIIWYKGENVYSLIDKTNVLISAGTMVFSNPNVDTWQQAQTQVNGIAGVPLSNIISADGGFTVTSGGIVNTWNGVGTVSQVAGVNTTATRFNTVDYYPVTDLSAGGTFRGAFKCRLAQPIGNVKFNKVALYASQYNVGDTTPNGNVCLFAEAYLGDPIVKGALGSQGFDDLVFDLQIQLHSVALSANWTNVFFATSADYFNRAPGGLYYPQRVGFGTFEDSNTEISATVDIRKSREVNSSAIPVLKIGYDTWNNMSFDVKRDGSVEMDFLGWGVSALNYAGALCSLFSATGHPANNYNTTYRSLYPSKPARVFLGRFGYPFAGIKLEYNEGYSVVINKSGVPKVLIGVPQTTATYDNQYAMSIENAGIIINEGATNYGFFKGGDVIRENENLLMYQSYTTATPITNQNNNAYVIAGINKNAIYTSILGQSGLTHKNLSTFLFQFDTQLTNMAICRIDCGVLPDDYASLLNHFSSQHTLNLIGRKSIKMYGPLELVDDLFGLSHLDDNNEPGDTFIVPDFEGSVFTRYKDMHIIAGVSSVDDVKTIAIVKNNGTMNILETGVGGITLTKDLYLIARNVRANRISLLYDLTTPPEPGQFIGKSINVGLPNLSKTGMDKGLRLGYIGSGDGDAGTNYGLIKIGQPCQIGQHMDPIDHGIFANLSAVNGIHERNRPVAMGEWTRMEFGVDYNFSVGYYTNISSTNLNNCYIYYTKIGSTMIINGRLSNLTAAIAGSNTGIAIELLKTEYKNSMLDVNQIDGTFYWSRGNPPVKELGTYFWSLQKKIILNPWSGTFIFGTGSYDNVSFTIIYNPIGV